MSDQGTGAYIQRVAAACLRLAAVRWLIPFLGPLGIVIFASLTWYWSGYATLAYIWGILGIALGYVYLVAVQGAALAWLIPMILFFVPAHSFFTAAPTAILSHNGQAVTAVAYPSYEDADGTWYCNVMMTNGAWVSGEPAQGVSDCPHEQQGDHVNLIVDTHGGVAPILAGNRDQWSSGLVVGGESLLMLSLTIAGAIVNGEYWSRRRNRRPPPADWPQRLLHPRGSSAHLWVPATSPARARVRALPAVDGTGTQLAI
jgi:hypothetical protein